MVNEMLKRRKFIFLVTISTLICVIIYINNSIYSVESFFSIILHPKAPIDRIHGKIYDPVRWTFPYAMIALYTKGRIYLMGSKKWITRILVINQQGKIERIITPYLKNGRFLEAGHLFTVSPSGNHIWTVEKENDAIRVTLHDISGKPEKDWLIRENYNIDHSLINSYSEYKAYFYGSAEDCLYFEKNQKPKKFKIPEFGPVFFHKGRYWGTIYIKLTEIAEIKKQLKKMQTRRELFCIITWSPEEGVRLFPKLLPVKMNIQWIDEKGNFYDYWRLRNPFWTLLDKPRIRRILQTLGFSDHLFNLLDFLDFRLRKEAIRIFSPEGELLEVIVLPALPRPSSKEKFKYGQLIKVNAKGIYMEVVQVNKEKEYEVKEYHIVRIVKKKRWQVWWEKLTRKSNLFPPKG